MIKYIRSKQVRLIFNTPLDFIREEYITKLLSKNRLIGFVGQRGVGKTTLLLQYLKQNYKPTEYLYFSGDDIYITDSSIYKIAEEFVRLGGKVIVIDEIHKYQNWAQEVKNIYDSFPNLLIRFSGSSMLNILEERYDLSRRVVITDVKPLSFREYMQLANNIALPKLSIENILKEHNELSADLALEHPTLYKEFLKYLQIGNYPFFMEDEIEYKNKLFNACEKVINEDIPAINRIDYSHLNIFKRLIAKLVYAKVPFKVNVSSLAREFGVSHPTVLTYLDILNKSRLIRELRKYSKKASQKPDKLYFGNSNMLYTFADEFGVEVNIGTLRETFFVSCFENIYYSDIGDFVVDNYIFEIGGRNKSFKQIKDVKKSYLVIDTDYSVEQNKIPLWLFGFLY
jgi:predicted AAA+ superfamily ATPase